MPNWWNIPRCEEGDLAFVKNGVDDGRVVRVERREADYPEAGGWPVWWVTSLGSPLPVLQADGTVVGRMSARIGDKYLIPMRMVSDAPPAQPQRQRRKLKASAKGGAA
jgi:hypothetical protein